jgi:hypothetical protein
MELGKWNFNQGTMWSSTQQLTIKLILKSVNNSLSISTVLLSIQQVLTSFNINFIVNCCVDSHRVP